MKTLIPLHIFILLSALTISVSSIARENVLPHSITIVTSNQKPLKNIEYAKYRIEKTRGKFIIYNLDDVKDFESSFSIGLPSDEQQARKIFENRMAAYGHKRFEKELVQSYQGLFTALVHKVDRYPVIIFNKTEAIYGVTDVKVALKKYQDWRQQND